MSALLLTSPRISPRTGRPVRRYNNVVSTTVKALDFDERAIRKLVTQWPAGARITPADQPAFYESWPVHLAAILIAVLTEPPARDWLLGFTSPEERRATKRSRGCCSVVAILGSGMVAAPWGHLHVSDLARVISLHESQ